jgi:cation/acetate symporter
VALAFAVASSANLPCVLLTLFWKRCNTGGIVLGMIVGTLAAIGLVLVSPNLTYPLAVKAAQEKIAAAETAKLAKLNADLAAATAPAPAPAADAAAPAPAPEKPAVPAVDTSKLKADIAKSEKAKAAAEAKIKEIGSDRTSIVGLEKPAFELRNPGLISIPLGFLAVIIGSLLYRDKRAEDMWDELYVRQNTGLLLAKPVAH